MTRILKGKCKCLNCKYAFTYTSDTLLSCSGYRTKKTCKYISWKESEILELLDFHFSRQDLELNQENINEYIDKIYLGENETYKVIFKNGYVCGYDGYTYTL